MNVGKFVQVKGRRGGEQIRKRVESRSMSGKENYDRFGCADRRQNNSMLPYHATNRKSARTKNVSSWSQYRNCNNIVVIVTRKIVLVKIFR